MDQNFARVAANFRQTPEQFTQYLRSKNSSAASIRRQIEAETVWSRLLRQKVQPFINVSEEEVKSVVDRMNALKGSEEYRVVEIYLSATPENSQQIFENGRNRSADCQRRTVQGVHELGFRTRLTAKTNARTARLVIFKVAA